MVKVVAAATLNDAYTRRLGHEKYLALAVVVLLTLVGFLGLLLHIGEPAYPDLISNFLYPLTSFAGASWAFLTAFRIARNLPQLGFRYRLAWLLVGTGLLANCFGSLYYTYAERSGITVLVPSLSDAGFTLFYPLIFIGLFLMSKVLHFRLRMALDALIATLCILGVSWFFFISKVFVAQVEAHVSIPELITVVSYPFWDMLLIFALMLLVYRRTASLVPAALVLFSIGMLANIWADTGYAYTVAIGMYDSVNFLIDPFWYLGFLLIGLAGLFQYAALSRQAFLETGGSSQLLQEVAAPGQAKKSEQITGSRSFPQDFLIYFPYITLLLLTFCNQVILFMTRRQGSPFLMGLTVLASILVATRFVVASRENEKLLNALALAKAEQEAIALEQAKLYAELQLAHERLQELDKLKDQFMITASHELRTPLTAIQGYLELLVTYGDTSSSEMQRDFLLRAQRGSEELTLLLNNVMDASRLEIDAGIRPADLEAVKVSEVIQSVIDLIEPQMMHERRQIEVDVEPSLIVRADLVRLRQVLLNLGVNAMKYSPRGTPLTFSARAVSNPRPAVIISVRDRGNGISQQDQARLFQRFVRLEHDLNSDVRGSGLGLYISRRLVEAMGGNIRVESKGIAGEGTIFSIQLLAPDNSPATRNGHDISRGKD